MPCRPLPLARLNGLVASSRGLSGTEAVERRQRFGANDIVETPRGRWSDLLQDTARDPMIWFLVGTAVVYALVGERLEAATLLAAIVPIVGMDAFLHRRTQASTEGLRSCLASHARVRRDDAPITLPAHDVLPGDLAIVAAGEPFPADGIVLGGVELQVDESALTGEAYPIRKHPLPALAATVAEPLVELEHWALAGTRLLTGEALVRVVYTGAETLYGEIVRSAVRGSRARTPLQRSVANLVSALVVAAGGMCVILALVRLQQGHGWVDALVSAVTLAVAALPEEFPVVLTFFLGAGVYRLARCRVLVRRAVSVENIGRVSAICCDKTGTMTEGRLHLTHVLPAPDLTPDALLSLARLAARGTTGDPIDLALASAHDRGTTPAPVATFPFTEDRKRETAIVRATGGGLLAVTKGAAELVIAMCSVADAERAEWSGHARRLAAEGHKVIACARRDLDRAGWAGGEPDHGFQLAGLLAFEDPVRPGVAEALRSCRAAGIHVTMVTGDHPLTARAVAREIGLGGEDPVIVSGDDVDISVRRGESARLCAVDVVARAVPAQKLALVRALQAAGELVAVTGDGVNDVPALQAADVGIAMGERGTRSAREVAPIVLLDDDFGTIVRAIAEGRQLFRNLRLSFEYLLMIHLPLVTTAALVPLAGFPLLYLPIHIVWLEMIIHPTAMLVFQDLPEPRLTRVPRHDQARFFSAGEWVVIGAVGILVSALVAWGYRVSLAGSGIEHGRAMSLAALTTASAVMTAVLSGLRTRVSRVVSAATLLLSLALVQTPALAAYVHVVPLHGDDLTLALAGSALAVCVPIGAARLAARLTSPAGATR